MSAFVQLSFAISGNPGLRSRRQNRRATLDPAGITNTR
jgi:hypothetical protein